jgi:hypothetical protein
LSPASFYRLLLPLGTYKIFYTSAVPEATIEALSSQVAALQGIISFPVALRPSILPELFFC